MRVNKFLAQAGLGSRRKCDTLIKDRLIKVNGEVITDFSQQISSSDIVQYKNRLIELESNLKYYILNKPRGFICSNNDPQKRKTIYNIMPNDVRIFSIGRLDYNTSGLILLTNDGDFSNFLCHPKNKILKKYYVETKSSITQKDIAIIKNGIVLENKDKVKAHIVSTGYIKTKYTWDVHLTEGKNREIKRIFSHFDVMVTMIHRYEFAGINIGKIKSGKHKLLNHNIIKSIKLKYGYKK
tara:strand:+ start:27 stop:743 length:717 start_codon:yes stop_codon:yes gene_type:complete